jgi:diguanylate cyclase (GGDEF)-like protein
MSLRVTLHVVSVLILTATALSTQRGDWEFHDPLAYLCYLAFAWVAFSLRVPSPVAGQRLSMGFIFIVVALNQLNLREMLQITGSVVLLQSIFPSGRKRESEDSVTLALLSTLLSTWTGVLASQVVFHTSMFGISGFEPSVRLVFAATACLLANHVPLALAYALTEKGGRRRAWQACHLWSYPAYLVAAAIAAALRYPAPDLDWIKTLIVIPVTVGIYFSYRLYLDRLSLEHDHIERLNALHLRTIEALALAIETRDEGSGSRLRRVQLYCEKLGEALALPDEEREALRAASLLYDIGKLAVPEHIRAKQGRLTPEEFDKVKIHPGVGADILDHVQFPYPVAPIVRAHHERWDGSGYPDGLQGEQIPQAARILAAADCLDALLSHRPYRSALPLERAVAELKALAGTHLDPQVVELIHKHYQEWEEELRARALPARAKPKVVRGAAPAAGFDPAGRFLESIDAARQEAQILFEVTQQLGDSLDFRESCQLAEKALKQLLSFDTLVLFVQEGARLVPRHVCGGHLSVYASLQPAVGTGLSGWVAANNKPILNGDPGLEFGHLPAGARPGAFSSALSVPLVGAELRGALTLYSRTPDAFNSDSLRVAVALAPTLAAAVERGLKFWQAESSSVTDYLTGLPNAQSLAKHLERELALSKCLDAQLAVVVCDLDGFKQVNDRFGHLMGNDLLRALGDGFRDSCREYDYVARMGGDEFALVLYGMTRRNIQARLEQLREMVVTIGEGVCHEPVLDASFGVAFFPADGQKAEELLAAADKNMYDVKDDRRWLRATGRANVVYLPRRTG